MESRDGGAVVVSKTRFGNQSESKSQPAFRNGTTRLSHSSDLSKHPIVWNASLGESNDVGCLEPCVTSPTAGCLAGAFTAVLETIFAILHRKVSSNASHYHTCARTPSVIVTCSDHSTLDFSISCHAPLAVSCVYPSYNRKLTCLFC